MSKRNYKARALVSFICSRCGAGFQSSGPNSKFCTPSCRDKARYARDKDKRLKAVQIYRDKNRELIRERMRKAYAKDPERFLEVSRASYLRHRSVRIEHAMRYQKENKHVVSARNARRRYRTDHDRKSVTPRDLSRLVVRYDGKCAYCRRKLSGPGRSESTSLQWDHVVPVSRGGRHSIGNLVPCCRTCNISKSARFLVEWTSRWYLNAL